MLYGGMPAIVLQDDKEKKIKLLEEYIGAYINKRYQSDRQDRKYRQL